MNRLENMNTSQFLSHLLQETARVALVQHTGETFVTIKPGVAPKDPQATLHVTSITLVSGFGRLSLKCRFDRRAALEWAAKRTQSSLSEMSHDLALDYMRELKNVQAGRVRGLFGHAGLIMGMSLPLSLNSEAWYTSLRLPDAAYEKFEWTLEAAGKSIAYLAEVELRNRTVIDQARAVLEAKLNEELRRRPGSGDDIELF
jgi:hypothetical protein